MVEEGKVEMIRSVRGLARNLFISKRNGQIFHFHGSMCSILTKFPKVVRVAEPQQLVERG